MDQSKKSAEVAEKRRMKVEDVQKRSTYRIAHGLEDANSQGMGGWSVRNDDETLGSGAKAKGRVVRPVGVEPGQEVEVGLDDDDEGKKKPRPPVKKWFGIW